MHPEVAVQVRRRRPRCRGAAGRCPAQVVVLGVAVGHAEVEPVGAAAQEHLHQHLVARRAARAVRTSSEDGARPTPTAARPAPRRKTRRETSQAHGLTSPASRGWRRGAPPPAPAPRPRPDGRRRCAAAASVALESVRPNTSRSIASAAELAGRRGRRRRCGSARATSAVTPATAPAARSRREVHPVELRRGVEPVGPAVAVAGGRVAGVERHAHVLERRATARGFCTSAPDRAQRARPRTRRASCGLPVPKASAQNSALPKSASHRPRAGRRPCARKTSASRVDERRPADRRPRNAAPSCREMNARRRRVAREVVEAASARRPRRRPPATARPNTCFAPLSWLAAR